MVNALGVAIVGIILTLFVSFGGVDLTKTAVTQLKTLSKDAFNVLGIKEDPEKSKGTEDRPVEDQ